MKERGVTLRIYYEDTDAGGIVYHANYLKFCERARSEVFFQRGMVPEEGENTGFVVRHIEADFLASSRLGDVLQVTTTILTRKKVSLTLLQEVWKEDVKLFAMKVTLVYVERGKPCKIPETFQTIFDSY